MRQYRVTIPGMTFQLFVAIVVGFPHGLVNHPANNAGTSGGVAVERRG